MREGLDQMDFVIATYAIGIVATLALVIWSVMAMRRAEKRREQARRK
ncbi:hypothetical protein [Pontixanthobacter aquaemixtae]|nr:hypothetical protein [Pontixanthobacter aquaemixtae]